LLLPFLSALAGVGSFLVAPDGAAVSEPACAEAVAELWLLFSELAVLTASAGILRRLSSEKTTAAFFSAFTLRAISASVAGLSDCAVYV